MYREDAQESDLTPPLEYLIKNQKLSEIKPPLRVGHTFAVFFSR